MWRWAIAGIGTHAAVRMAPAIAASAQSELAAVWSRDIGRAQAFARKHGGCRAYDSYGALLDASDIDVIYIATPNNLHAEQTIQAARAGKHVLCEKPMALAVSEACAMIEACEAAGVKLGIAFQNRHHPAHQEARRLVRSGEAGEVAHATAHYSHNFPRQLPWSDWRNDPAMSGGGALMGMGVHALDLLRFVLHDEPVEVIAFNDAGAGTVDRSTTCMLRFARGALAYATCLLHLAHPRNDLVVHGALARVEARGTIGMPWQGELCVTRGDQSSVTAFPCANPVFDLFVRLVEDFNCSIERDAAPLASGYDGLASVHVAEAIVCSAREGRAVKVPGIRSASPSTAVALT
jgi:1,5-anhydro-D-fructose reductase (1,5-anhydro-D-mannitol-forming)